MLMRRKKIINKAENKSKLTTDVSENGKSYKSQCNVICIRKHVLFISVLSKLFIQLSSTQPCVQYYCLLSIICNSCASLYPKENKAFTMSLNTLPH